MDDDDFGGDNMRTSCDCTECYTLGAVQNAPGEKCWARGYEIA
ncbi:hypothetical protein DEJ13_17980 (plasmid) [Curtobacterium sp. MCLR17_007]|nr:MULTISPECIES: hypothetical protein [Microbacteriaceae]WIB62079.1 hypothetical protein DEJ13_17980 [Curtobacterium sp. MCLR17_007]